MDEPLDDGADDDAVETTSFDSDPASPNRHDPLPEAHTVAHFTPTAEGTGLDGSTPLAGGIQGRLTAAGGTVESERRARDWERCVEVDQPVQSSETPM